MNSFQKFIQFAGFWQSRAQFYRDVAIATDERELFRDFLEGEHQIAKTPATANSTKAKALRYMRVLQEQGITGTDQLLTAVMPNSDALGIAVIADAKDKAAALRFVAENVEQQTAMSKIVRGALTAPMVLLPVAFAFSAVMAGTVIPAFEKAAPPEVWVGFSALVRDVSLFVRSYGVLLFGLFVAWLAWFLLYGLANITSMWRYRCERATGWERAAWLLLGPVPPILTIYRDIQSARMMANLATLIKSGRGLQEAIIELAKKASPWLRKHLLWVVEHLQLQPGDYVGAFGHGVLSTTALARMHTMVRRDVGHDFGLVLVDIGTSGQEAAREAVARYAYKLNAYLLIGIFAVILFFYGGQNWIMLEVQEQMSPTNVQRRALEKQQKRSNSAPMPSTSQATPAPTTTVLV